MSNGLELGRGWEASRETFLEAHAFMDVDGRPLGELNAPEHCLRGVRFELRTCRYTGSRSQVQRQMNVSALRQLTENYGDVIGGVRFLRSIYLEHFDVARFDYTHLWRLAKIATTLPAYLLGRRRGTLRNGELPVVVAGVFKVLAGVFQTVQHMRIAAITSGDGLTAPPEPRAFLDYAERHGLLIGRAGGVCAGPPAKILEVVEALLLAPSEASSADFGTLPAHVGAARPFLLYAGADTAIQLRKFVFGLEWRALLFQTLERVRSAAPDDPRVHHLAQAVEDAVGRFSFAVPELLLSAHGDPMRHALIADLETEIGEVEAFLDLRGSAAPLSAVTQVETSTGPGSSRPLGVDRQPLDPGSAVLADAHARYLTLEDATSTALHRLQGAIDSVLERDGPPPTFGLRWIDETFGPTPRTVLAALLQA